MSDDTKPVENKTKGERLKTSCPVCGPEKNHLVVQSWDTEGQQPYNEYAAIWWEDNYQIIQCQGCDTVSFRHRNYFSEYDEPESGFDGVTEKLYPIRIEGQRTTKDFYNVSPALRRIYRETVDCFNLEAHTLCAAGLRAMVEGVCSVEGITDGPVATTKADGTVEIKRKATLEGKIFGLAEKNILTNKSAEILHQHRYLGNEALHELGVPSRDELALAVDILEHVLENIYEIPQKALELKSKVNSRKSKT